MDILTADNAIAALIIAGIVVIGLTALINSSNSKNNVDPSRPSPQDRPPEKIASPPTPALPPQVLADEKISPDAVAGLVKSKKTPEAGESSAMDQVLVSQLVSRLTQELALNRDELTKIKWACRAVALGIAILILVVADKQ